ncbi:MAG: hypothetical protein ABGX91_09315 [Thermoleophilia bacterium]
MRVTAPALVAAALATGAAIPALGAGAAIGLQDDRMAATSAQDIPTRLEMLKATKTKISRVDLFWATAAPTRPANDRDHTDPAYDWSWADATLCGMVGAGIQPIVTVWNAPGWATGGVRGIKGVVWNSKAPKKARDFADFMFALSKRYNGRTKIPGRGKCQVNFYEIWNEPNLQIYLYPQYKGKRPLAGRKYVQMANLATPQIKKANRRATVITGVTGPKGRSDRSGRGTLDWIRDLRRYGLRPGSDYSQHIYPSVPPLKKTKIFPAWDTLDEITDEVNRLRGGKRKRIYITEASYTTATTPYRKVKFTKRQQASYMKQIFRVPFVRSKRVRAVIWFNLQDNVNWPGGLLTDAGTKKPSYRSFQQMVRSKRPKGNLRVPRSVQRRVTQPAVPAG